jgi:hypothetical protein
MASLWERLAQVDALPAVAQIQVAEMLVGGGEAEPERIRGFFDRDDLDPRVRSALLRNASATTCVELLSSQRASQQHARHVLARHPRDARILSACFLRADLREVALTHLRGLGRTEIVDLGEELGYDDRRSGLIEEMLAIVIGAPPPSTGLGDGGKADPEKFISEQRKQHQAWGNDVSRLLGLLRPEARTRLAAEDGDRGDTVRQVLLDQGSYLDDTTLPACLPAITDPLSSRAVGRLDTEMRTALRLHALAHARKFPRYLALADSAS